MPEQQQHLKRKLITLPSLASKQLHSNRTNELKIGSNSLFVTHIEFDLQKTNNGIKSPAKNFHFNSSETNAQLRNFQNSIKHSVTDNDDEMENLYWHTHGSLLWHTAGVNNENYDSI